MCLGSGTTLVEQLTRPFSAPLAQHLDHYSIEDIDFFIRHMSFPPKLHTFRIILQAKLAPNLEQELASRTSFMVPTFLRATDISLMLFVTLVFQNINWPNPKSH
jgi:transformation/transcription domain-associated protein